MLRLIDVKSGYGRDQIINGVTLDIKPGEIIALIGVNGSGKSTLLKTALGLISSRSGEVFIGGTLLKEIPHDQRAGKISLLESQTPLAFPMTVEELLLLSARKLAREKRAAAIDRALKAVEMHHHMKSNLLELSSGETRRALIAHTLCIDSKVTMLDEPFAHLDWRHQKNLADALKDWSRQSGTTFVVAIHELEWAAQIADRVCALDRGRVIAFDVPEKVFGDPAVREVFAFEAAIDENPIDKSRRLTLGRPS